MKKVVTLPKLKSKLQCLFNEYIRLRDISGASHFKCISCDQIKPVSLANAGHYYNVGHYDGLRFDEDNCHCQCVSCNNFLHGNLIEHTHHLPFKIGLERFEKLKVKAGYYKRNGHKWDRFTLQILISEYQQKIKELQNAL